MKINKSIIIILHAILFMGNYSLKAQGNFSLSKANYASFQLEDLDSLGVTWELVDGVKNDTLNSIMIVEIKKQLQDFSKYYNDSVSSPFTGGQLHLKDYNFQLLSFKTLKNQSMVMVNAVCRDFTVESNWRDQLLEVYDAGICYFKFLVDFEERNQFIFEIGV